MAGKKLLQAGADALFRLSPKGYYALRYYAIRHRLPHFAHPTDISEWMLAEMLRPDFRRFAPYVDKVKVRDYVQEKGLRDLLPALYGCWERAEDIDFDTLPDRFALKTNNGCGGHIICTDKAALDREQARQQMASLLQKRFSIREPHYQYIHPLVYAEEFIGGGGAHADELPVDYKFHCIKGHVNCILTCSNRNLQRKTYDLALFDTSWNVMYEGLKPEHNRVLPTRPSHLSEMLRIAEVLSEDFDFVRVDLYDVGGKLYFGELTFTPASGLLPYVTDAKVRELARELVSFDT